MRTSKVRSRRILAAAAGAGRREFRHSRLLVGRRIGFAGCGRLQESDAAQTGLAIAALADRRALRGSAALLATATLARGCPSSRQRAPRGHPAASACCAVLLAAALTIALLAVCWCSSARGRWLAVGLLRAARLTLLLLRIAWLLLAFLALAPTLVVALDEAAHGLDHAVIVVGVLPVGFGQRCDRPTPPPRGPAPDTCRTPDGRCRARGRRVRCYRRSGCDWADGWDCDAVCCL